MRVYVLMRVSCHVLCVFVLKKHTTADNDVNFAFEANIKRWLKV